MHDFVACRMLHMFEPVAEVRLTYAERPNGLNGTKKKTFSAGRCWGGARQDEKFCINSLHAMS